MSVYVRVFIAAIVVAITWHLASEQHVVDRIVVEKGKAPRSEKVPLPVGALPDTISKEWEAIFVLVLGYYFAERPKSDAVRAARQAQREVSRALESGAMYEAIAQCLVAAGLVVATVHLFVQKILVQGSESIYYLRDAVDGAWIAGVAIAAGFYFKDPETGTKADDVIAWARAALAAIMVGATGIMYLSRAYTMPRQWIALVILVVAFYFKEKK